jgi:phosphoribosyl 1,2-cyclic phosphate phosphodiesterase
MSGPRSFTFLGTGTSVGVPMLGCDCAVCQSDNPHNHRDRCGVLIRTPQGRILIDTPPELRLQLLREKVGFVHAILFTHFHADHLFGLDDVRPFSRHLNGAVPVHCTRETELKIRESFAYAFDDEARAKGGFVPQLEFQTIHDEPFRVLGESIVPVPMKHAHFNVLGFRIGDLAYCTDVNYLPPESLRRLEGLNVLILDALRPKPHPAHFSLGEALEVIAQLKPQQAYLTHLSHELEHEATSASLPRGVKLAYDGLTFAF